MKPIKPYNGDKGHDRRCVSQQMVDLIERIARLEERADASVEDVDKALSQMEHRLLAMNEFRDTIKDYQATTVTRNELGIIRDKIESDIRVLRESKALLEGKASSASVWLAYAMNIANFVLSFLIKK